MKRKLFLLSFLFAQCLSFLASAQSVRLDATVQHQHITGFGGFVCSPQFGYNHMSTSDIKKVWGQGSTVGCNIMRLYIPIGRNAWNQSLQTAKTAKQLGLIVFASPWGQPAEWKTNGTSNAKNSDGTTGKLKRENWPDYAQYLEDYVQYLRQNGVELDAISIQNEPDWPAEYAGCLWSAQEIAEFVKTYGSSISCKVMAPETLAVSDSYVNALNNTTVLPHFDIYGGHQYGGIQSAYKKLAAKGKELWMTEYLINWNEAENNTRNFSYEKDVFNFFRAINTCMLGDFNAWIHYAAKRYYGMLGDGQRGTTSGTVTKRGYVMAHFARFVTGMNRIDASFVGTSVEGSAYLSESGDTAVVVLANEAAQAVDLTVDLPFYTTSGSLCTTTKTKNFTTQTLALDAETCRPKVNIPAQGVATVLFVRSRDRQHSNMTASVSRFDRIDDMTPTRTTFGTTYKLSGKTKTFDHSNPLISTRTNASSGYLELSDRFSQLVMEVKKVSSTMNYTTSNTTLIYVNGLGQVASHNYGELDWNRRENFSLVFDLSPATLTDGCRGLISLTNNNWSSVLTVTFGDVYLGSNYAAKLSGDYVADDSNVLDFSEDAACTSLDLSAVSQLPASLPWLEGTNRVAYVSEGSPLKVSNVVSGSTAEQLSLSADGGDFRPAKAFTAGQVSFACAVDGLRLLMLPFNAVIPDGAKAYALGDDLSLQQLRSIPAHTPVLVEASGNVAFTATDAEVAFATSALTSQLRGTYVSSPLFAGDYVVGQSNGQWGLVRLGASSLLSPFDCYAAPASQADFIPFDLSLTGIQQLSTALPDEAARYDLQGRRVGSGAKGLHIVRSADGKVRKVVF
ncbi:MAG: hypothetical protein K6D55_00290 [Prevotella sp.]|nr:hypothetical protein [Prevotella sp.]